jgi:hypothetical protein
LASRRLPADFPVGIGNYRWHVEITVEQVQREIPRFERMNSSCRRNSLLVFTLSSTPVPNSRISLGGVQQTLLAAKDRPAIKVYDVMHIPRQ